MLLASIIHVASYGTCTASLLQVALVAACHRRGLRVLSVAGAGAKADPTRLKFVDVSESSVDPLARALRTRWGPGAVWAWWRVAGSGSGTRAR